MIPGTCPRPLLPHVSAQKYSASRSVPGSGPICPSPQPDCVARPLPTPALATSIDDHQYSWAPGAPVGWEGGLQSFPGSAISELVPHRAVPYAGTWPLSHCLHHGDMARARGSGRCISWYDWKLPCPLPLSCRAAAVTSAQHKSGARVPQRPRLQVPKSEAGLCWPPRPARTQPWAPILLGATRGSSCLRDTSSSASRAHSG